MIINIYLLKIKQGKSPKTVSDKNWIHGTREHLRPDTMWADERFLFLLLIFINFIDTSISINKRLMKQKNDYKKMKKNQRHMLIIMVRQTMIIVTGNI